MHTRKSPITRTKSGCNTCRRRKVKCDERKPGPCQNCDRLGVHCTGYGVPLVFRDDTESVGRRVEGIEARKWAAIRAGNGSAASSPLTRTRDDDGQFVALGLSTSPPSDHQSLRVEPFTPPATQGSSPDAPRTHYTIEQFSTPGTTPSTHNLLSDPSFPDSHERQPGTVDDAWLSHNFPSQLPPVFREVWEGVGHANTPFKYALLSLRWVEHEQIVGNRDGRSQRIEYYSLSLQAMAQSQDRPESMHISQVCVVLATLSLFLRIETKIGTFKGGFTHFMQADSLVAQHITELAAWELGKRLLCAWVPFRCWYSSQCSMWGEGSTIFPLGTREPLLRILRESSIRNQELLPLLCESQEVNHRVMLSRLVGINSSWPSYNSWRRDLASIGKGGAPDEGLYQSRSEQSFLDQMSQLRRELDNWHDSLPLEALPIWTTTSHSQEELRGKPKALRFAPLRFHSHAAAMTYMRYAAAQSLCSQENINACTGSDLSQPAYNDPWTTVLLQILAGIDAKAYARDDQSQLGVCFVLGLLALQSLDPGVIEALDVLMDRLEGQANSTGSTNPPWLLRSTFARIREERKRGRVILHIYTDFDGTEEWETVYSHGAQFKAMLMGRSIATGEPFHDIVNWH
ncbi:hypothetical protein GQ53DRAFT_750068 [Thozetella sp. PMI_491]|nr:hypothetical protein GQ53DRAFT_750068 [Thozetella sp. PMI_491]